ncbi:MAG TPA: hypothetical protein VK469_23195 [Candidatus Kapabacteria bacterium]|nr:hypothetical protein [Candidatus Kapabacteria bacterium]
MRRFFKITGIVAVNILVFLFLCLLLEFGFGMKCPSAAILQEAERMKVECFDMASEFGNRAEFFYDMFHYSPVGINRFAICYYLSS